MFRLPFLSIATSLSVLGSPVFAQDYFEGQFVCDQGFRLAYLISDEGAETFRVIEERSIGFNDTVYVGQVEQGETSAKTAGFGLEFMSVNDDALQLRWHDRKSVRTDCQPFMMNRQLPPVDAYAAAIEMAQSEATPEVAARVSVAIDSLPPAQLLPTLDQATLPAAVIDAANAFWARYMSEQRDVLRAMPLENAGEVDQMVEAMRRVFSPTVGPRGMLLADNGYAKIYAEFLQETAERIDLAGYDVSAMTTYDEGQFCGVILDTKISSYVDVIYGLPYPFWTRAFTETAIVQIESCGGLGKRIAKNLADDYPDVLRAQQDYLDRKEELVAQAAGIVFIEAEVAKIESMPVTAETYFATDGYAERDFGVKGTAATRTAYSVYLNLLLARREASEDVLRDWVTARIAFSDEELLDPSWVPYRARADDCGIDLSGFERDYGFKNIVSETCEAAAFATLAKRSALRCERSLSDQGYGQDLLDMVLLLKVDDPDIVIDDMTFGQFYCQYYTHNTVEIEKGGFLRGGYNLTVTLNANPDLSITVHLVEAEINNSFSVKSVDHSVGGDLADLKLAERNVCILEPRFDACLR